MTFQAEYGSIANYTSLDPADRIFLVDREIIDTKIQEDGSMLDRYKFMFLIPELGTKARYLEISLNVDEDKWVTDSAVGSDNLPREFHTKSYDLVRNLIL